MSNRSAGMFAFYLFGFWPALGLVIVTARLFGLNTWPWWLVTAPFWLPLVVMAAIVVAVVAVDVLIAGRD